MPRFMVILEPGLTSIRVLSIPGQGQAKGVGTFSFAPSAKRAGLTISASFNFPAISSTDHAHLRLVEPSGHGNFCYPELRGGQSPVLLCVYGRYYLYLLGLSKDLWFHQNPNRSFSLWFHNSYSARHSLSGARPRSGSVQRARDSVSERHEHRVIL